MPFLFGPMGSPAVGGLIPTEWDSPQHDIARVAAGIWPAYLERFRAHGLTIDRSFVVEAHKNPGEAANRPVPASTETG